MRDQFLEELARISARVDIEVVLEDLAFLDAEAACWPPEVRRRILAEGLYRRRFFDQMSACDEMADLWMRLKEYFGLTHPLLVRALVCELSHHCRTKGASPLPRGGGNPSR